MFDDRVFHVMRALLQDHQARWAERMPDLTKPQYAVLEALGGAGGLGQRELGEASATTKATLTEMLVRMEARDLIERRADVGDARRRLVYITAAGARKLAEARLVARAIEAEMLGVLDHQELSVFTMTLSRLRAASRQVADRNPIGPS